MRKLLLVALWGYFAWYAGALAAEALPVPGEIGLIIAAVVIAARLTNPWVPALCRQRTRTAER